jgi:putative SOS response-associated peptidase YedK
MVCRVFLTTPSREVQALFGTVNPVPNIAPNHNAAPGQRLPVARLDPSTGTRSLDLIQWGIPFPRARDVPTTLRVDVTCETVATKPAYRDAFEHRRCLVPVDGLYAWQKRSDGAQQVYAIMSADRKPLALAGLWDEWGGSAPWEAMQTFTIVTGPPNGLLTSILDRMPTILPREAWSDWLGERKASTGKLLTMLRFYSAEPVQAYPVASEWGITTLTLAKRWEPFAQANSSANVVSH